MQSWMTRRQCGAVVGLSFWLAGGCGSVPQASHTISHETTIPGEPMQATEVEDAESGQKFRFVKIDGEWTRVRANDALHGESLARLRLEREREINAMVEEAISAPAVTTLP